jgi:hypothetical protein
MPNMIPIEHTSFPSDTSLLQSTAIFKLLSFLFGFQLTWSRRQRQHWRDVATLRSAVSKPT